MFADTFWRQKRLEQVEVKEVNLIWKRRDANWNGRGRKSKVSGGKDN